MVRIRTFSIQAAAQEKSRRNQPVTRRSQEVLNDRTGYTIAGSKRGGSYQREEKLDSPAVVSDSVTSTACSTCFQVEEGVCQQAAHTAWPGKLKSHRTSPLYTVYT